MNKYNNLKIEKKEGSKLKIYAEIDKSALEEVKNKILEDKAKNMVMPGFRKGEAPKELVAKHLGEENIYSEALRQLSADSLAQIIIDNKLKPVGSPQINIDDKKDSEFFSIEAELVVLPEIELGDYKEAVKKINQEPQEEVSVSDEDVQEVIKHLRREKARILLLQEASKDPSKAQSVPDINSIPEDKLPNLDEIDYKELAGASNEEEFKAKIKEQVLTEKKIAQKDAKVAKLLEAISKESKLEIPEEMISIEIEQSLNILKQDLAMMGMSLDAYLKQIGKTLEELKAEMREPAKARIVAQLALSKIAELESIQVDKEKLEKELEHLKKHYPQANPDDLRFATEARLLNEATIAYLESIK